MEWRMVMRRCPSRWMTLVGDTAQTGSPAGVDSWSETLAPFIGSRFVRRSLTVNYRTPKTITDYAREQLPELAGPVTSIRDGEPVRFGAVADLERFLPNDGRSYAIIRPGEVEKVKGLEFDHVIVVNPDLIRAGTQGEQNLYVALTRATQTLTVLS